MSLLQNAIESIQIGVEDFLMDDDRRHLSAVRNISAGILLLYKEKLIRLSPPNDEDLLIKSSIQPIFDDDGELIFTGKGNKTVDVQTIKQRFKSLGIEYTWRNFDKLNELRNNIEHYYTDKSPSSIREVIVKSFALIHEFINQHLEEETHKLLGDKCWQTLLETSEVYKSEEEICRQTFKEFFFEDEITELIIANTRCPSCHSSLIKPTDLSDTFPSFSCSSCQNSFELSDGIEERYVSYKNPYELGSYVYCMSCQCTEYQSSVELGNKWVCFECHDIEDEIDCCDYCQTYVAGTLQDSFLNGCLMCEGQMSHYMSSKYD